MADKEKKKEEALEVTLDTKQCAEIALMMYEEWKKAMEPPLYVSKQFDEWLKFLLEKEQDKSPT